MVNLLDIRNLVPHRRLPPTKIEENLNALLNIRPDFADDLLGSVDQPLKLLTDKTSGREYLACDYNRDADSYRLVPRFYADCVLIVLLC